MWGIGKVSIKNRLRMAGVVLVAGILVACTPRSGVEGVSEVAQAPRNRIEKMALEVTESETSLLVTSEGYLTYTAVKEKDPPGVRLYFPDTVLAADALPEKTYGGAVLSFFAENISEAEVRLGLVLRDDIPYEVKSEGKNALRIAFDTKAPGVSGGELARIPDAGGSGAPVEKGTLSEGTEKAVTPPGADTVPRLVDIRSEKEGEGVRVNVLASAPLRDVHVFTVENPPRIVLDIAGLRSPFRGEQRLAVGSPHVHGVRHYAYPDKVRVVLDTTEESLRAYESRSVAEGYAIFVSGASGGKAAVASLEKKSGPAEVKDLGFTALPEGRSQVFIETTQPVTHEITMEGDRRLRLFLKETHLPQHHQRPLITRGFESALDQVLPSMGAHGEALFVMELREPVPYVVNQQGNRLELRFEASRVGPRPIEGEFIGRSEEKKVQPPLPIARELPADPTIQLARMAEKIPSPGPENSPETSGGGAPVKAFSGTPISIDFYETDIKNVFRILQHISGRNFAIDKDVSGKVTMSLEHPVPWDQIMDLVLRMNGLGMIEEGNIIRIATMTTLRREESLRQEVLRARQENERRESDLAPLMTEYILINYSNVSSEIMPHVQNLLTERGKASADVRNNQLILTDTAEVIGKARSIIARIDKITPQVVIEARIVEASDDFERNLGAEWQGNTGGVNQSPYATVQKDVLGGRYGYNVSLNTPTGAGNIGLHFARIAGSQLALNARLNLSEQRGETKIVSSPRIVTLDNKTATINQGFEYPYTTRNKDGDVITAFKNVDLKLEVTPHVTADNRVAMKVSIDKNDIHTMTVDGPALRTKKVDTELLVNDGDTIVIGGVVTTDLATSNNRIPFFSQIPLLGWLFQSQTKKETKSELLIFLTPRIVQLENPRLD
jgi:type IV pilus assembly protein PilQ